MTPFVVILAALSVATLSPFSFLVAGYVICPYCDPNYMAFPNLEEAMRGYDVPMGNPNPGRGSSDPGIRNQIFVPMFRNQDGHYRLNIRFITANAQIKCDATWSTKVYDNFRDYVMGKMLSSTTGYGIEAGPSVNTESGMGIAAQKMKEELERSQSNTHLSVGFPHLFSRSWGKEDDVDKVMDFFTKEKGSIVVSEAVCLTHKVDIADKSRKYFVEPFVDSVKALHAVTAAPSASKRVDEFKRFVNEFGTHYASTTEMGTRLSIETRYTKQERASATVEELKDCNRVSGLKVFGFQSELNSFNCSNAKLKTDDVSSDSVERMVVSTYGSFIADSLSEWSKQVISLVQENAFSPRPIRRELRSILHLLEDDRNFADIKLDEEDGAGGRINGSAIAQWMAPLMANYCQVFELDCTRRGCGIDDDCDIATEICQEVEEEADGGKSEVSAGGNYTCLPKNVTATLPDGGLFVGGVDDHLRPHGFGRKFYPAVKEKEEVLRLEYEGQFFEGMREGEGREFFPDGKLAYSGHFKEDKMDGRGTIFYEESGHKLFDGDLQAGRFHTGLLFRDRGGILAEILNRKMINVTQKSTTTT